MQPSFKQKKGPTKRPPTQKPDFRQEHLLLGMKKYFPELFSLLSQNNEIMPYILKYVLPYLYASGMPKKKILEVVKKLIKAQPNKEFFESLSKFILKYGTPDGTAVLHFLSSEGWK